MCSFSIPTDSSDSIPYTSWCSAAVAWVAYKYITTGSVPLQLWVTGLSELPVVAGVAVAISNALMIGLDVLRLTTFQRASGSFILGNGGPEDMPLSDLITIDPAWSIGLELWFYIVAPFLARCRKEVLLIVALLSAVIASGSQSWIRVDPYWLFPAQLWLFVIGMLMCRTRSGTMSLERLVSWRWAFVAMFIAMCASYHMIHKDWRNTLFLVCLCAILPAAFGVSKESRIDRWVGNLSYGVYLVHWPVNFLMKGHGGENRGMMVCVVTFVLVIGIHYLVEEPIDRWRQRRALGSNRAKG